MKWAVFITLFFYFCFSPKLFNQDVELLLSVEEVECTISGDVEIEFFVNNWESVGGVSGTIEWDPNELSFQDFGDFFPSSGSFLIDITQVANGYFTFNWFSSEGTDLVDGSVVMTISFQLNSPEIITFHELNFSNIPTELEVVKVDSDFNVFEVDFETINGGIETINNETPELECVPSESLELDENGELTLNPDDLVISASIACGTIDITASQVEFDCNDLGENPVTITATADNGNTDECTVILNIITDDDPDLECFTSFTIELDETGQGVIEADELVSSATAVCGDVTLFSSQTNFGCIDIGFVLVTVVSTGENGNTSECTVNVEVEFNQAPVVECIDDITLSLDENGEMSVDPGELVAFSDIACGTIDITANATEFSCDDIGENMITVTATGSNGQTANCNLTITIISEDEPELQCVANASLELEESGEVSLIPTDLVIFSSITCGTLEITASQIEFDCEDLGINSITLTATADNGNTSECTVQLTIFSDDNPFLECVPSFTIELDEIGEATLVPDDLVISASAVCGEVDIMADITEFSCDDIGSVSVTITASAENQNTTQCVVSVMVEFNQAPELVCIDDITLPLDENGEFSIDPNELVAFADITCGTVDITANPTEFDCNDIGENTVTVTATGSNGQITTCELSITITSDDEPEMECVPTFSLELGENGEATLDPNDLVVSATIACGTLEITASQTEFDCDDLGSSTLILTATGNNGNTDECSVQLTVFTDDDPELECVAAFTVELDENGEATLNPEDFVSSASAVCGDVVFSASQTEFDCDDIGIVPITITATGDNGNTAECVVDIEVEFNQAPVLECIDDITLSLDENGEFSVDPNELVIFADIACGTVDITASPTEFDCDDIGDNTVTVTATGSNGQETTCELTITITSEDEPELECVSTFSLDLDENGEATLNTDDLILSVSVICGMVEISLSQTDFDCEDIGVNTISLIGTASANNSTSECEIVVTVEDNQPPTIECQDVEYFLEEGSSLNINLSDAIVILEDNCQVEIEEPLEVQLGCTDLGENIFDLTAIDQGGNISTCTFTITFIDSLDLCNQLSISGQLLTEDSLPIGSGDVFLSTNGVSSGFQTTSSDGLFEFENLAFGSNQVIETRKNINPMNGVTTWDIVLTQAHILGLRTIDSPYKLIAADVRPDGTLNVFDLIDMRELILGRTNRFPQNQSWIFINSDQDLPTGLAQPPHPDDLETIREYDDLSSSINDADFIGVKIGDVNNSNNPSSLINSEDRSDSNEAVSLSANLSEFGDRIRLDFFIEEKITPIGMQFAFKFDPHKLEFKDWKKGILPELLDENFNFQALEDGVILLSWNSFMDYKNAVDAPLFSFYFRKKNSHDEIPDFNFSDQDLISEVVIDLDNSKPLSFRSIDQEVGNAISQIEVRPNPFSSAVEIRFFSESYADVTLEIYNDLGQHLFTKTVSSLRGQNSIQFEEDKFQNSGIYHFRLQSENAVEHGRLIFIQSN